MRLSRTIRTCTVGTALALTMALAAPALAHPAYGDGPPPDDAADTRPEWKPGMDHHPAPHRPGIDSAARESWLRECEQRLGYSRDGKDRYHARQQCSDYLDDYYARSTWSYGGYYGQPGYGGGCCGQPMMMVPVMMMPAMQAGKPECTETVEVEYVDVPVRARARPAPQKRVKVVPDKRVKVVPDKRIVK